VTEKKKRLEKHSQKMPINGGRKGNPVGKAKNNNGRRGMLPVPNSKKPKISNSP